MKRSLPIFIVSLSLLSFACSKRVGVPDVDKIASGLGFQKYQLGQATEEAVVSGEGYSKLSFLSEQENLNLRLNAQEARQSIERVSVYYHPEAKMILIYNEDSFSLDPACESGFESDFVKKADIRWLVSESDGGKFLQIQNCDPLKGRSVTIVGQIASDEDSKMIKKQTFDAFFEKFLAEI